MKKQFLILGKELNKIEQKEIFGGVNNELTHEGWCNDQCQSDAGCPEGQECFTGSCDNADTKLCRNK